MLGKMLSSMQGYKTYGLLSVGTLITIVSHFWGPLTIAGTTFPQTSTADMWRAIWQILTAAAMRSGITLSGQSSGS